MTDRGRGAVLADPVLAAANWGIVPEPARAVRWTPAPAPATHVPAAERELLPVAPSPAPMVSAPRIGLHALTLAERLARPAGPLDRHLRILDGDETRSRRLRLGSDPALVVSCWSDASAAKELDSELVVPA
jgi:hypothetical protein